MIVGENVIGYLEGKGDNHLSNAPSYPLGPITWDRMALSSAVLHLTHPSYNIKPRHAHAVTQRDDFILPTDFLCLLTYNQSSAVQWCPLNHFS